MAGNALVLGNVGGPRLTLQGSAEAIEISLDDSSGARVCTINMDRKNAVELNSFLSSLFGNAPSSLEARVAALEASQGKGR